MKKRLVRSAESRVFAGVMGGIGEYFDVDPVLVRLIYLLATVFTGFVPGIVGYLLAVAVVPAAPRSVSSAPSANASTSV